MSLTTLLLVIFSSFLAAGTIAFVGWGIACAAAGREFERMGLPGDIVTALRADLYRRAGIPL